MTMNLESLDTKVIFSHFISFDHAKLRVVDVHTQMRRQKKNVEFVVMLLSTEFVDLFFRLCAKCAILSTIINMQKILDINDEESFTISIMPP